jgi:CMP-N-acetylneuraminic acid synthetase
MEKSIDIVIPIKRHSTRVKNKNTKTFYKDLTLLHIKLAQALPLFSPEKICVVTDSRKALNIAQSFRVRSEFIDNLSDLEWPKSITAITKHLSQKYLCIYRVTTPFLGTQTLKSFIDQFFSTPSCDSGITVEKVQQRLLLSSGEPLNFTLGTGHINSQDICPFYKEVCGISIIDTKKAKRLCYHFGKKPMLFTVDAFTGLDINEKQDWQRAQSLAQIPSFKNLIHSSK